MGNFMHPDAAKSIGKEHKRDAERILNLLRDEAFDCASVKGFHDEPVTNATHVANLHSEVSEFWESHRRGTLGELCDKAHAMYEAGLPPLTNLEEEISDIIVRALDLAKDRDVNIGRAVVIKMAFNWTREHRNGGKLA